MHSAIKLILNNAHLSLDDEGIYAASPSAFSLDQASESALRERVAGQHYDDYLEAISHSHSVEVMDAEVDRFLGAMPIGASILDIGGCWGWHWRRIGNLRPDIGVVIVDFVRANFMHAKKLLGPIVGNQVALVHADATALPFKNARKTGFDGAWSVQVLQHIPNYCSACGEAHRVLKPGGRFISYSLHRTPFNRLVYKLAGKPFHFTGMVKDAYYLERATEGQRDVTANIFQGPVMNRYSECLFHPDLRLRFSGRQGSWWGKIDACLSSAPSIGRWIARQRSFEAVKQLGNA